MLALYDAYNMKFIISSLLGAYITYYFFAARSPPVLYGHSRKLVDFFRSHVPFLSEVYSPFVFGFTGRVQTILRPILHRVEKCKYEEEVVSFVDGGEMTLSWSKTEGMTDDTPIVVLLPGLTGCGCCEYIVSLVKEINRYKYSLLVFNYLADEPQDRKKPCPLTAAMCICMPWDVLQTSDKLEKTLDWLLFNMPLTHGLRRVVKRNADVLSKEYDVPRILKSRSIREFDENLTACMFGYKSEEEYYSCASTITKIDRVCIPILCLDAADDPFVPFRSLPLEAVREAGSRVVLALTRHGGHIGFLAGLLPTGPSLLDRAVPQFVSAVFQHPEDFAIAATIDDGEEENKVRCEGDESESTKETTSTL